MTAYLWGVATLPLVAYLVFGPVCGWHLWREYRHTEHWQHQYRSRWVPAPFYTRNRWIVGALAILAAVGLWPLVAAVGRFSDWNWRRRHNAAARQSRSASTSSTTVAGG